MVLQLLDGVASRCQHKNCGDGKVNISETCFAFSVQIYSPYIAHLIYIHLIYAHLIYEVHSADSETDKGALQQPE